MKVENQKPWLFEINNLDSNKINPFLSDSSYLTIEFKDHYVICPSPQNIDKKKNFIINSIGEIGKKVDSKFEYSSDKNNFLSILYIYK